MLSMSMKWLSLSVRQNRGRREPLLTSQHWQPRWSREGGILRCKGGVVTPFSSSFSHGSSVWPSIQGKTENYPYPHGQKAQNKIYETQGKKMKFLLFIAYESAILRCAAASPLPASSAAKGSILCRAGLKGASNPSQILAWAMRPLFVGYILHLWNPCSREHLLYG